MSDEPSSYRVVLEDEMELQMLQLFRDLPRPAQANLLGLLRKAAKERGNSTTRDNHRYRA